VNGGIGPIICYESDFGVLKVVPNRFCRQRDGRSLRETRSRGGRLLGSCRGLRAVHQWIRIGKQPVNDLKRLWNDKWSASAIANWLTTTYGHQPSKRPGPWIKISVFVKHAAIEPQTAHGVVVISPEQSDS
jgi:hypothetical protein